MAKHKKNGKQPIGQSDEALKKNIDKAKEILEKNLKSIRTIEKWADVIGYEPKIFGHYYRKIHGLTCKKAMINARLKRASHLISTRPELKYYQIAEMVGLADEYALNKYFKRHTGNPPSYFRKNGQEKQVLKHFDKA